MLIIKIIIYQIIFHYRNNNSKNKIPTKVKFLTEAIIPIEVNKIVKKGRTYPLASKTQKIEV